jgi:hypothetical protein
VTKRLWWGLLIVTVAGCAGAPRPRPPPPPSAQPMSVSALAAVIEADAKRSDHETDSKARADIAADASRDADSCLAQEPQAVACLYGRGVASGLQARAHPAHAIELLNSMLDALARADAVDPNYDEAGPSRVRALVLLRAPGWPLGPGDADGALVAARRAVALKPLYPANLLALAEALAKTGDGTGARDAYSHARDAALALPASDDRDEWLRAADQGLAKAR